MKVVSDRFLEALASGDQIVTARAEFRLQGTKVADVPIVGGETKEDKSATFRNTCNLTLDTAEVPLPGRDYDESPIWPTGNEILVWSGFEYSDGTKEELPQGLFRIAKPRIAHTDNDLQVTIESYDRGRAMSRNKFTNIYIIPAGRDFASEIKRMMLDRLPYLSDDDFQFMATDGSDGAVPFYTPRLVFSLADDPWVKALEMAASFGAELFFDGKGRPILRPEPDPLYTPPDYRYISGEQALLESITRDLDDEEAYNGVIITGQNTENVDSIPRGEAWDTDVNSPTYYDPNNPSTSLYGAVPLSMTSDYVTTNGQAERAARSILRTVIGIMEAIEFSGISNPAQEGGDILQIKDPESGVNSTYILDSLTKGLGSEGGMSGTTRKRRVV